jgi:Beta-galactosidase
MPAKISGKALIVAWLALLVSAADGDEPVVETSNAVIEARDGARVRVVFAAEGQPAVLFKPAGSAWDWSRTSKLVIPVENPGGEPLTLLLRVSDDADRSLSGTVSIAPGISGDLTLWIDASSSRKMGMIAGPSLTAGGLEQHRLPITATEGSVDASRVTSVRLGIVRPTAPRQMVVGPLRVTPPSEADSTAYQGIVDGFGQFHPGGWPEKVTSVEMLGARGAEEARELAQRLAQAPERDRFGGLLSLPACRATGFFRTERRDGRWWLVTPEGHGFFSIGVDAVAPSGATYVKGREFMFRDLPTRDGELAAHWSETDDRRGLGAQRGRAFDHGGAFDFYTANLERKFGAEWRRRWREETADRLTAWGFNTIGNWSDPDLWAMHRLPYTVPLSPEGEYAKVSSGEDWWGPMPDPFDPRFAEAADKMARNAAARFGDDPWLIGYFVDNELSWGRSTRAYPQQYYALATNALAAGRQSPANSAFVADLIQTYREPDRLAQAWGVPVNSWDDVRSAGFALPEAAFANPVVTGDLATFSRRFAEAYYRTVAEALRRHDPDHLYLGSRFAWQTAEAVEACARWCDVVSFNRYRRSIANDPAEWAKFHALGKPALIGEFHFGSADRGLFWEGLVGVGRESERGPAYARYLRAVADNPDFVGAHWFQYLDEPLTGRTLDGENAHIGFVTVADVPYEGLVDAARTANLAILRDLQRAGSQ